MTVDWRRRTHRAEASIGAGDSPWGWAIVMPYRCLANPEQGLVMPASPENSPDEHENHDYRRSAMELSSGSERCLLQPMQDG